MDENKQGIRYNMIKEVKRMELTIEQTLEWLHKRLLFGPRPGLKRVEALLEKLDNPQCKVSTIHIAGTNGKGSTVTYLRCMLEELGLKVGTFTSPYIETFNERISVNGQPISDEILIKYIKKYQPIVASLDQEKETTGITEFEILTALAMDYFLDEAVDIAIIEVGLGGLLDSTNIVHPMLTAITTIGKDHTEILGDTLEEIAYHKAGIIKQTIPLVTGNIEQAALQSIEQVAQGKNSPIYRYQEEYQINYVGPTKDWQEVFDFYGEMGKLDRLKIPLLGKHQTENAGVAIQLFYLYCQKQSLNFQEKDVYQGLLNAKWPARMERMSEEPLIIIDGAHNVHAMKQLVENFKREFTGYSVHILFSALATKDIEKMIFYLKQIPNSHLSITSFDYPKVLELSTMEKYVDEKTEVVSLWQFGLGEILEKMATGDILLVTGSLYFVSQVRELLLSIGGNNE
ncbi:folylpolyglutamate synthase FolC [Melissococcus plutonius]|nr:folylpolyglutamate synthase FolC [Melissococcus plutonius]